MIIFTPGTGEVFSRNGRDSLRDSGAHFPKGRIAVVSNFKNFAEKCIFGISMIESVFCNVPCSKLHTWIRFVSTTPVFKIIVEQLFFRTFQFSCFKYLDRPIFVCFWKTPCPFCSICFSILCRFLPFLEPLWKVSL